LILWLRDSQDSCAVDTCPWYLQDAALGDADAQLNLAEHHRAGTGGMPRDIDLAMALYEQAARQGHAIAQFKLGVLRKQADGNAAAALEWWRMSAGQGYAKAQRLLADHEAPGHWLRAAAEQDDHLAMYELYRRLSSCGGSGLEGGQRDGSAGGVLQWLVRAARHGHATAQFDLGAHVLDLAADVAHATGRGGPASGPSAQSLMAAALGWLVRAAEGGDGRAHALLSGLQLRPPSGSHGLERALLAYSRVSSGRPPGPDTALADLAWAAGVCCFPPALAAALQGLHAVGLGGCPLEAVACAAWASARCELRSSEALDQLQAAVADARYAMTDARCEDLGLLLWSLATLSLRMPEATLEVLWSTLPGRLRDFSPSGLARSGWALTVISASAPPVPVSKALAEAVGARAGELCAEDLANVSWALARLRCGEACAAQLLAAAGAHASDFGLNELANVTWALAVLAAPSDALAVERLAAAAARVASTTDASGSEEAAGQRARLDWAMARLREPGKSSAGLGDGLGPESHVFSLCWSDDCAGARASLQALLCSG